MPDLVQYHIARLKDKNPRVRAAAAHELGLLGDAAALSALEELFQTDRDPEVKRAAQEAGRAIFKRIRLQQGK
ncbi:MAG: HEAT repeat domain-containing protein [Anaerolineae bacterium]|nr:HEAT repeat domain-containing protein [Anaerolineae bacterium]